MAEKARQKKKAAPKSKVTRRRKSGREFAARTTFNPPATLGKKRPAVQGGELADEDLAGRFIGRFQGAGQPPLPRD